MIGMLGQILALALPLQLSLPQQFEASFEGQAWIRAARYRPIGVLGNDVSDKLTVLNQFAPRIDCRWEVIRIHRL